jgi:hypothetical protein
MELIISSQECQEVVDLRISCSLDKLQETYPLSLYASEAIMVFS